MTATDCHRNFHAVNRRLTELNSFAKLFKNTFCQFRRLVIPNTAPGQILAQKVSYAAAEQAKNEIEGLVEDLGNAEITQIGAQFHRIDIISGGCFSRAAQLLPMRLQGHYIVRCIGERAQRRFNCYSHYATQSTECKIS